MFIFADRISMAKKNNISSSTHSINKIVSVFVMCIGLLFLNGANFFVYAEQHFEKKIYASNDSEDNEAPSPVEEKSKSSNGLTDQEEYLHDKHSFKELELLGTVLHHRILDAEKLQVVHYELISPPPKA